jgi:hypothetical protein
MEMNKDDNFLLEDDSSDNDDDCEDVDENNIDSNYGSIYVYDLRENKTINTEQINTEQINTEQINTEQINTEQICNNYSYNHEDQSENYPRLVNVTIHKSWKDELNAYFKLNNLFTCIKKDENRNSNKQKQDMSVSKIIMNNILDKKLGSVTYYYGNKKSAKAYYTYDYPEIYYNKKLYNNITEWLKQEFSKKI